MAFGQALHASGLRLGFLAPTARSRPREGWAASIPSHRMGVSAETASENAELRPRGSGSITSSPMSRMDARNTQRLVSRLVKHGASLVPFDGLVEQAQIIWRIGSDQKVSDACLHAEEFMASAARNCRRAISVMDRMRQDEGARMRI